MLDGALDIGVREEAEERRVHLEVGDVFVVPRGVEHRPESAGGASLLLVEPSGTMSTGDAHDELPDHIDSTTGHTLAVEIERVRRRRTPGARRRAVVSSGTDRRGTRFPR